MKVLALATYPVEAAATRYRLQQFVEPLAKRGIDLTVDSFLDPQLFRRLYQQKGAAVTSLKLFAATIRRLFVLAAASKAKVVLVQREAMMYGPPVIEWIVTRVIKRPMVLDLDDATYVSYTSPTYGSLVKGLKWFRKTDDLIRWAALVSCGNRAIAEYVSARGAKVRIIPTVVDTEIFHPIDASLYSGKWASGKSGFKAIQYMAVGIPYVATAVGASAELGDPGTTHFFASSENEWYEALEKLISDPELRAAMGA